MPRVTYGPGAIRDLQRIREFLRPKNPAAAARAANAIRQALRSISSHPLAGRPIEEMPETFREWIIPFGDNGYVARYQVSGDDVTILAIRHQREVGYAEGGSP